MTSIETRGPDGLYRMSIAGAMDTAIGRHGLTSPLLADALDATREPLTRLKSDLAAGRLPALAIARETRDIPGLEAALVRLNIGARLLVFLGLGGSSLGGQTLAQLGGWNVPGNSPPAMRNRPRTRFYDNLDAETLAGALAGMDFATTRFVVTSKSGGTPETLVQAIAVVQAIRAAGLEAKMPELMLAITEPAVPGKLNGLRALLSPFGVPIIEHNPGIGGRFSVLSNVGMVPALARGLDIRALRRGAAGVLDQLDAATSPDVFAPAVGAALSHALARDRNIMIQVMMPYADRLRQLGPWFGQLWAESLGKSGRGTMPVACLGPLDQHSQLQMLLDGPRFALVTVIRPRTAGRGITIDPDLAHQAGLGMMAGRTVGDLIAAQTVGVPEALNQAGRPVRLFDLDQVDEATLGALLMHFMIETILAGWLLGIDPFDQPAVELGKVLTRQRLEG